MDPANRCRDLHVRLAVRSADLAVSEADRHANEVPDADRYMGQHIPDDAHVVVARAIAGLRYLGRQVVRPGGRGVR
jgi:hypothetical protein